MDIQQLAEDFTAHLRQGDFDGAAKAHWAEDVASVEPPHAGLAQVKGKAAVGAKNDEWAQNHEVHSFETKGPYVNGDQFALFMSLEVTRKATGERITMDEVALYTVRGGKIVEERFFY